MAQQLIENVSSGSVRQDALRQLSEVLQECGQPNWDGYGAQPILLESYEEAKRFLTMLPTGIPGPEVSAEPDGEITFESYSGPARTLSVSVGPNNELTYAGLFGASRAYGTEAFHDEIPEVILNHIQRVMN